MFQLATLLPLNIAKLSLQNEVGKNGLRKSQVIATIVILRIQNGSSAPELI